MAADTSAGYTEHVYDALGRLAAVAVRGNGKLLGDGVFEPDTLESLRLYVYDGWRLVSELDGLNGNRVVAEYVPGPTYVDDVVAARRDQNRDGDFNDAYEGFLYYLTDQQHSTVALLDGTGAVVERYGYDAFGAPSFHDPDGNSTTRTSSAVGNDRLYTGRQWLPALKLYDYRQRLYDPAMGRFLTRDPVYDPANLGNPYTYVGNNPGAFVDPYGLWGWDADYVQYGLAGLLGLRRAGTAAETWRGVAKLTTDDYENIEGLVSFAPIVGIPADLDLARKDFQRGNHIMGTIGVLGVVPVVGDIISGVAKGTEGIVDAARATEGITDLAKGVETTGARAAKATEVVAATDRVAGTIVNEAKTPVTKGGAYVMLDQSTGEVMRTGRSRDLARRRTELGRNPDTKHFSFEPVYRTDIYEEQRGLEELLHDRYNPPLNKIRPISPTNPNYQKYLDAARDFLGR